MKMQEVDKELNPAVGDKTDVEWFNIFNEPFSLHGLSYEEEIGFFTRMPMEKAVKVRKYMDILTKQTAGGRIRFITDSPYVCISSDIENRSGMYHMPLTGSHGFGVYANNDYYGVVAPAPWDFGGEGDSIKIQGAKDLKDGLKEITVCFPHYNGVKKVFVGLKKGSTIKKANDYSIKTPVLFYGSSITQGGCVSHPGVDYVGHLSRWLDFDFINFGFSGTSALEPEIADYMIEQNFSLFFMDYDAWGLNDNHEEVIVNFIKKLRNKHPNVPVVLTTRPDFYKADANPQHDLNNANRNAYKILKKLGYKNIYYVDATKMFGKVNGHLCSMDTTHPSDLGFYQMAKTLYPIFKKALKHAK